MKKNQVSKPIVQGAWLITWSFRPNKYEELRIEDENQKLKEIGIDNKIIDVVKSQVQHDYVRDHVERIYKMFCFSCSEKIYWAKGTSQKKDSIGCELYDTFLFAKEYREFNNLINPTIIERKNALEKWKKTKAKKSEFIRIGRNLHIHARRVRDLRIFKDNDGKEIIKWKEYLKDGELKEIICKNNKIKLHRYI